jgi:cobalamin synthase
MIDYLVQHIFYITLPSIIWLFFTLIVFLLWIFGTDTYDKLNGLDEDENGVMKFFGVMGIICVINIVVCLIFSFNNPLNWIINCFLLFSYIMMGGALFIDGCTSLRKYCRNKRGKK